MISDTLATTMAQAQTPTPTTAAISSDFQTFLKMLTVQLQNQDPLNPVDSNDYAVQLATFSGVEQQVLTNDLLKALAGQMGLSGMTDLAGWVGREVRVAAPAAFTGTPITVVPHPAAGADSAELVVLDATGAEVQRLALTLTGEAVDWAGVSSTGAPFPNGTYTFLVASFTGETSLGESLAEIYAAVEEVQLQDDQQVVLMTGGIMALASSVTAVRG